MAIDRTNWNALVDSPLGDDSVGTRWTKDIVKTVLLDPIDAAFTDRPGSSIVTTTGNIAALALPTGSGDLVVYMNNATPATIQGIAAGLPNQRLSIVSIGVAAGHVLLSHQDAAATAALRLINIATSGKTPLAGGTGTADLRYDATSARWRLIRHEQGAWITPTFAAGDFVGNGAMTWTLTAGDVTTFAYRLSGRTIEVHLNLVTTTVGGTPNVVLRITNTAWGGFTAAKNVFGLYFKSDNAAAEAAAKWQVVGGTTLDFFNGTAAVNWTASTNATAIFATAAFEVV